MTHLNRFICLWALLVVSNIWSGFADAKTIQPISQSNPTSTPKLQHAKVYKGEETVVDYWVSEKLDGVRAYWDGVALISRQGHTFNAPEWFVADFPNIALDGELWIARGQFERVSGIVRTENKDNPDWQQVRYMIFDLPALKASFDDRVKAMKALVQESKSPYLKMIAQQKLADRDALEAELDKVIALGGEGLMMHLGSSYYQQQRTANLLKVKRYQDAEAVVLAHLPGKGKYQGMMGALKVKTHDGVVFKIGSGFSDAERKNPPKVGAVITFKYFGLSNKGTPKFASFIRIRAEV